MAFALSCVDEVPDFPAEAEGQFCGSAEEAHALFQTLVPPGTSVRDAIERMKSRGFNCHIRAEMDAEGARVELRRPEYWTRRGDAAGPPSVRVGPRLGCQRDTSFKWCAGWGHCGFGGPDTWYVMFALAPGGEVAEDLMVNNNCHWL